ncbi:MAG: lipid IV(A) 3-deoxy-D-manno-octulosonic acid transferase [Candidatus Thiodiazotropha lotti]|uniref:3-deoxy-D-manno-octulosonic acid transferase n=1 Tax=Candidatus Thiodiazotropha lotti TaxID=2792787 RepID=A0A9E4K910_9GAMM|nr:lipid IV(A) 3-deoxy-D-manno-octulosonic acid transferase [Candidatus Thiodiazotropha lotti]ODC02023.1 3-deoxy-D-manno-octulosonic acid transferase [Candidatus Thiodiazotropha endoloripes]MCG7922528.1 lipid IV(A) 3-deoxy-D-manno-octulosonic acid transferase [Candidatus Thiodiazotropha lotti]MCG7932651.1 lipid IV(A) 3-deoxy-D-manno-octulosonic acid transferase [Candidatus Thiodiazotropha lotti]MCG7941439.1 lipid IV(A) 3-deoxy-D-manno-octulosonic acid transferase [Candidatus Thiodiazotropha lot
MRYLYTLLLMLLTPLYPLRLFWRARKAPAYRERWLERFGVFDPPEGQEGIWIHAVSVGEVQAIAPLVGRLLDRYPDHPLLITTTTPTGADRVNALFGNDVAHRYAPVDLPWVVQRYLQAYRPRLLILVETEIWPNLIYHAKREKIPTLLANARMSVRSARGYHKLAGLTRQALRNLTLIAPHAEADAERFHTLGARPEQLEVIGSIKYDIHLPGSLLELADVLRREWGAARPVWIAASTHEGEDELLLQAHMEVRRHVGDALLVLVPRHPERFERVAQLVEESGFSLVRRSQQIPCDEETGVFLGDTMGELTLFIGASDAAFIGGSLVPHGGHNILEAAAQGVAVVFGPHMFNFNEIKELFTQQQAAVEVASAEALAEQITQWLSDASERSRIGEAGRELVDKNRGALDRLTRLIEQLLDDY